MTVLSLATLACLAACSAPAGSPPPAAAGASAYDAALRIAKLGPRPAAGRGERRAHEIAARAFRRAGLRVRLQRFAVPGRGRSRNVVGVIDTPARCLHVLMAHADSTGGPGANDNASGVGSLMALARRLRPQRLRCDAWLVATGAEERIYTGAADHLGALALVRRLRSGGRARSVRFGLSLDEVGRGRSFWLRSPAAAPRAGVERRVIGAARRTGTLVTWVREDGTGNSDHRELELFGIPAAKLGVGAQGEPCRHTPCDRPGRLQAGALQRTVRTVSALLER